MFSLQRKLSTTQMAPSASTASSLRANALPPATPSAPGSSSSKAGFSANPLAMLTMTTPVADSGYKEGSPTTHSASNNETTRNNTLPTGPAPSGPHQHGEAAPASPHSPTFKVSFVYPPHWLFTQPIHSVASLSQINHPTRASSSHTDSDASATRHSLGMLKSIRSLHVDSHQQRSRAIARDFSLPPIPVSSLLHENCSSLKDQFLKIKERFSAPSPVAAKPSKPSASSPPPAATDTSTGATVGLALTVNAESNESGDSRAQHTHESDDGVSRSDNSTASLTMTVGAQAEPLDVQDAKKHYSGESKWPQLQVERWYVEDNFFKGSVTCWTMDKGAEIVSRIATVMSTAEASSQRSINPDISLQWIGRQLWAITVSLPLTRSGELKDEHMELARRIDEAIAAEESKLSASLGSSPSEGRHRASLSSPDDRERDNQIPTVVLREPDVTNALPDHSGGAAASSDDGNDDGYVDADVLFSNDLVGDLLLESVRDCSVLRTSAPVLGSGTTMHSSTSAGTAAAEDDTESGRALHSHDEDSDVVASLPLSWSMLSNTSISESAGGGSLSSNDPRDDDQRCPPEKTGWLKKKTGLNAWQQRYFELKGNRLYYFANETDGVPRGAVVLDHAHVLRGKGEQSMSFSITTSSASHSLQILKFSARMTTTQVHLRKSCVLRVTHESEENVGAWVTALNRASFYCNLTIGANSANTSFTPSLASTGGAVVSPGKKKKVPFYRLRASSSSASSADDDPHRLGPTIGGGSSLGGASTVECASYHHFGSVKYLQDTNPLLWEIHPHDQVAIRKKATLARTRSDYLAILSKYSSTFQQIFLPRPRPISLEQTLRDILPELFLINNILYGGGDENNGLENIFEVLDSYIKRFARPQEERVRAVSTLLQACARTISGGDSYFVIHSLLGNPFMIIRPAEARGHPIEIEVSPTNPSQFLITVFSAFSFHHVDDVEKYGDASDTSGGTAMTPEPLLRVKTHHIQEFDFGSGKSSRWLRIRVDGMKHDTGSYRQTWSKSDSSDSSFGALLDPLA